MYDKKVLLAAILLILAKSALGIEVEPAFGWSSDSGSESSVRIGQCRSQRLEMGAGRFVQKRFQENHAFDWLRLGSDQIR